MFQNSTPLMYKENCKLWETLPFSNKIKFSYEIGTSNSFKLVQVIHKTALKTYIVWIHKNFRYFDE